MLGVDAGFTGDRWDMLVNVFSEVVESVLADGRHKPSGELVRPKSNVAARSAEPAREVTRTITRPMRKEHFGLSTRRAPSSPHSISASLSP